MPNIIIQMAESTILERLEKLGHGVHPKTLALINRLANEGYDPDYVDSDNRVCFRSKNENGTMIRIHPQDSTYARYYTEIACSSFVARGSYFFSMIILTLNDHGISPVIPTKGVFDESS